MTTQVVSSGIPEGIRNTIEVSTAKLLGALDCRNVHISILPALNTQQLLQDFLRIESDDIFNPSQAKASLEGWFLQRTGIRLPDEGSYSRYFQQHQLSITSIVWHGNYDDSYLYTQKKVEQLQRTLELNKSYASQVAGQFPRFEVLDLSSVFGMSTIEVGQIGGTSTIGVYRSVTSYVLELEAIEPSGRQTS